jgi:hypothetical protein
MNTLSISATQRVVPGAAAPPGVAVLRANNNLDAIDHDGRRYLVWRTAPIHFASSKAMLHVVACDARTWTHETSIALGRKWNRFEPDRVLLMERIGLKWSDPVPISPDGYLAWRPRVLGGRPVLSVYGGGGAIYTTDAQPHRGRAVDYAGRLVAGAHRPVAACRPRRRERDRGNRRPRRRVRRRHAQRRSARWLGIGHLPGPVGSGGSVGARRQRAFGGRFDLGWSRFDEQRRTKLYQGLYWASRKRTALWRIDAEQLSAEWLCDIPSRGDTCFPAVVPEGDGRYTVYNYSSPIEGRDRLWFSGQLGPTWIYATEIVFSP